ncbi:MAG: class I SAM-dependent methyltransferase [Hyphomicrobiales bacterium]
MLTPIDKLVYTARQSARVAWYMGHYFASRRYHSAESNGERQNAPPPKPRKPGPGRDRMLSDLAQLFQRDLANAEAGHYPLPRDHDGGLGEVIAASRRYFADLPSTVERKAERRGHEIGTPELRRNLPDYFLQNFHYQTDGYLTEHSAKLYDTQVEVLFSGSANAMRRQCLVPLSHYMRGRDQRSVRLLDVACGTGRFLRFVKQAWPRMPAAGLDLSDAYLAEARHHLKPYRDVGLHSGNAEAMPYADASFDVVTSIYLFHEVPPEVRRTVAGEFARILKPGGRLIFMDSLQHGDVENYDALLETFPVSFHEPYYPTYTREDLPALFAEAGLEPVSAEPVFLSKLVVCDKAKR